MLSLTVVGRLGGDATKKTVKEKRVLEFSVASNRGDESTWVRCTWWQPPEKIAEHLKKGTTVGVSGRLTVATKDGKTYLDLRVDQLSLAGSKPGSSSGGDSW